MPALENTITTQEMIDGLNIEMVSTFDQENDRLSELLGIFDVEVMAANTTLNQVKVTGKLNSAEVPEGDEVPLSEFKTTPVPVGSLTVHPYRKVTTAQAILKSGMVNACTKTDDKMVKLVRQERLGDFFGYLANGTGTADGKNLQSALAHADAVLRSELESHGDSTERIIHFVNTFDIADYLADANVTVQTVYGMQYIQSFLGVTDIFVTNRVAAGTLYATPVENIHIYAADFAELAKAGMEYEVSESGLIGVAHQEIKARTGVETYILTGMLLFAEILDYIVKATFGADALSDAPTALNEVAEERDDAGSPSPQGDEGDATGFDPAGDAMPTMDNKVDEINAFADAHGISLSGCSNKTQMLEAIAAAMASGEDEA